jgi:hypothetical protein
MAKNVVATTALKEAAHNAQIELNRVIHRKLPDPPAVI